MNPKSKKTKIYFPILRMDLIGVKSERDTHILQELL